MPRPCLAITMLAACTELTTIGPERLPPPEHEPTIEEGEIFGRSADLCPALAVGDPVRLSATPGESLGVRMATITKETGDTVIAVAWIELPAGVEDPEVVVRFLRADGVQYGPLHPRWELDPIAVSVFSIPFADAFGLVVADGGGLSELVVIAFETDDEIGFVSLDGIAASSAVALDDEVLIAGPASTDDVSPLLLARVGFDGAVPHDSAGEPTALGRQGSTITIAPSEGGARAVWLDEDRFLVGGSLAEWEDGAWSLVAGTVQHATDAIGLPPISIDAVATTISRSEITVASVAGALGLGVGEFGDLGWQAIDLELADSPVAGLDVAREEGTSRVAIARVDERAPGAPGDLRLTRNTPLRRFCASPTDCVDVTTDLVPTSDPAVVALRGGYAVAWLDQIGGQRDVFWARLECRGGPGG